MEHRNAYVPRHRLGNCDPGPDPRIVVVDHYRHRTRRDLQWEAPMTCATISYFTAVLGALVGFFVANIFRAGGRS
jgi:hypothetical protein